MTVDGWIDRTAGEAPDRVAIAFEGEELTYRAFAELIETRAAQLHARGVVKEDRIAWLGMNAPEVFVLLFAAARLGAVLVPLNWRLADAEVAGIIADCAPMHLFHDDEAGDRARALAPDVAEPVWSNTAPSIPAPRDGALCDPLLIVYTSGSTGVPKGAVLAQEALVANAAMSVEAHRLVPEDRVLTVLPLFHVGGLNILPTPAFSIGATVVLHRAFHPARAAAALSDVATAIVVPTVLQAVLTEPGWAEADLSALRCFSFGSTDVPRELINAVHARGVPVIQVYGATETAPFAIYQTVETAMETAGSIGRVGSACEVRLVGAEGQDVAEGTPGEIWVKGANTLLSYWKNAEETEAAIQDGWFRTGDVASVDADGNYWFADRIKHVIISGGENIYPAEIERVLREHPKVAEVSVVGAPHAKWGETPVAVVAAEGEIDETAVLGYLEGRIARYKRPTRVVFVDALPRNAMGKVVTEAVKTLL